MFGKQRNPLMDIGKTCQLPLLIHHIHISINLQKFQLLLRPSHKLKKITWIKIYQMLLKLKLLILKKFNLNQIQFAHQPVALNTNK